MATLYIKYAKKWEKCFFSKLQMGMVPFGQGVATPMLSSILREDFKFFQF